MAVNVTSSNEFYSLIQSSKPSVVNYTASWCGPCKMIKPFFEQLAHSYHSIQFLIVDVDHLADVAGWAGVRAMPTFIAYKNGYRVNQMVGVDKNALHDMVNKLSYS